jgi:hypothetical protein
MITQKPDLKPCKSIESFIKQVNHSIRHLHAKRAPSACANIKRSPSACSNIKRSPSVCSKLKRSPSACSKMPTSQSPKKTCSKVPTSRSPKKISPSKLKKKPLSKSPPKNKHLDSTYLTLENLKEMQQFSYSPVDAKNSKMKSKLKHARSIISTYEKELQRAFERIAELELDLSNKEETKTRSPPMQGFQKKHIKQISLL